MCGGGGGMTKNQGIMHLAGAGCLFAYAVMMMVSEMESWIWMSAAACAILPTISGLLAMMDNGASFGVGIGSMISGIAACAHSGFCMISFAFASLVCEAIDNGCIYCETASECNAAQDCQYNDYGGYCEDSTLWSTDTNYAEPGCVNEDIDDFCAHLTLITFGCVVAFGGAISICIATYCNLCCGKNSSDADDDDS